MGSNKQRTNDLEKQVKGKAQKPAGDVQDTAADVADSANKSR